MKIGIIGAIKEEIEIFETIIYQCIERTVKNHKMYIGTFKEHKIFLIKSGIGKVSASIATMILIDLYQIDVIINSGSAGSLSLFLNIGDVIIPDKICYYDVDLTNFGYSRGQIPKYPKKFIINKKIHNFLKKIFLHNQLTFTKGLIISGDSFIRDKVHIKKLKHNFSSAVAVEMEAAAIAQICYRFNIPLIVVKSISDLSDNNATVNFQKNISIASLESAKYVKIILKNIIDM